MELRSIFRNFFFEGRLIFTGPMAPGEQLGSQKRWLRDLFTNHPVCAAKEATRHFINGAATPPVKGGEWARLGTSPIPLLSKEGWPHSGRVVSLIKAAKPPYYFPGARTSDRSDSGSLACWR